MENKIKISTCALIICFLLTGLYSCTPDNSNTDYITQASVVGCWTLNFQWKDRTPGTLTVINFADQTCLIPSDQAGGSEYIVTGITNVVGNQFTWTFYNGSSTETYSGEATANTQIAGTMSNNSGNSGSWSSNQSNSFINQTSIVGTWTMYFKWKDRTPGSLTITNYSDQTCQIAGGQNGGPSSTISGTTTVKGNQYTWVFYNGSSIETYTGIATSYSKVWGKMINDSGNSGFWAAEKN
jgi:hypothetical protein